MADDETVTEAVPEPTEPAKRPRTRSNEVIEDAVVVEEPVAVAPSEPTVTKVEPVVTTADVATTGPTETTDPKVVYFHAPAAPKKRNNRGIGSVLAIASALIFGALFVAVVVLYFIFRNEPVSFRFMAQPTFYVPVLLYAVGAVLLVVIVNRAGWAAYVLGSIFVGLWVYFGTVGIFVLSKGIILASPADANALWVAALTDPLVIAAAFIAREVSMWTGALIARRGRRLRSRNAEAHAAWQQDIADKKAEHERAATASAASI